MTIAIKYLAGIVVISMIIGGAITAKFVSSREVVKTQTIDRVVVQDHVVTVVKEIDRPDGTKEITTTADQVTNKTDNSIKSAEDLKPPELKNWMVSGGIGLDFDGTVDKVYDVNINRRILGPIFVGAWANTKSQAGLNVGFEF